MNHDNYFENYFASKKMSLSGSERFGVICPGKVTGKIYIGDHCVSEDSADLFGSAFPIDWQRHPLKYP